MARRRDSARSRGCSAFPGAASQTSTATAGVTVMNLERLGATAELRASLFHIAPDLTLARVIFSHRERYRLIADCGDLDAQLSGALWYRAALDDHRSEERRVGKECRSRWAPCH